MKVLDHLINHNRLLKFEHRRLIKQFPESTDLLSRVSDYLDAYVQHHGLAHDEVLELYWKFASGYSDDIKNFQKTGKYPKDLGGKRDLTRLEYDLALMASILFSEVRYCIMRDIFEQGENISGEVAMVGVGSGIDLLILLSAIRNKADVKAYDLELSEFVKSFYSAEATVIEGYFDSNSGVFDHVFAIELLEHMDSPFEFVEEVSRSLRPGGRFYFTTATNMPQVDHLYNFDSNVDVLTKLKDVGLLVSKKVDYPHKYIGVEFEAKNTFYVAIKP